MRRDLRAALDAFAAEHRGVRLGQLFGQPAVFAGRKVFARLTSEGVQLRLPPASNDASGPARRSRVPPRRRSQTAAAAWTTITPHSSAAGRLEMLLEQAARYVALA